MSSEFFRKCLADPEVIKEVLVAITTEKFIHPSRELLVNFEQKLHLLRKAKEDAVRRGDLEASTQLQKQIDEVNKRILDTQITIKILELNEVNTKEVKVAQYNKYEFLKKKVSDAKLKYIAILDESY